MRATGVAYRVERARGRISEQGAASGRYRRCYYMPGMAGQADDDHDVRAQARSPAGR